MVAPVGGDHTSSRLLDFIETWLDSRRHPGCGVVPRRSDGYLSTREVDGGSWQARSVVPPVEHRAAALRQLSVAHALAIRLRDAGVSDELIADCLAIERVAVGPLLIVADAKLKAILDRGTFE